MKYTSTPSIAQSNSLVSHYGAYIDKIDWTFYCTFSTRYPLTLKLARTYMERLHIFLEVNLKLCNNIFWVAEPFDSKYGYHIHTVVKLNCDYPHNNAEILNKAWQIVTKGSNGKRYFRFISA